MNKRAKTDFMIAGFCVVVFVAITLGVTHKAHAQRVDSMTSEQRLQQNELDLRFMQKEIAKMRYSEVCATIKPPPAGYMEEVKSEADKGSVPNQRLFMWLYRINEAYTKAGCGDA